jgi:hypothetical protein
MVKTSNQKEQSKPLTPGVLWFKEYSPLLKRSSAPKVCVYKLTETVIISQQH